jgi:hypothetical protein
MPEKQVIAIVDDDELASEGTIDLSLTEIVEIFPISNFFAEIDRLLAGTILLEAGWLRNSPLNGWKHERPSVQLRRLI